MRRMMLSLLLISHFLCAPPTAPFLQWGRDKKATERNRIRSMDLRSNKLGDQAAQEICKVCMCGYACPNACAYARACYFCLQSS